VCGMSSSTGTLISDNDIKPPSFRLERLHCDKPIDPFDGIGRLVRKPQFNHTDKKSAPHMEAPAKRDFGNLLWP